MGESGRIRFGIFEFDPATRALRRDGAPVRLQAQPAQVLAVLLEHAGELVTRDTLREAVWGSDTFVDFDRGLNFCIAQIRSALGDSADSPRYVRTVPKRGYQFIAPADSIQSRDRSVQSRDRTRALASQGAVQTPPAGRRNRPRLLIPLALAALVAAGILAAVTLRARPVNIAITRFDNETGDQSLDSYADGLTDGVVSDLTAAAGARYGIIGNAAILRQPRNQRDLRAIGDSLHAAYVVLGQVQKGPAGLRVLIHLIQLPEQKHLKVIRIEGPAAEAWRTQSELPRRIATEFIARLDQLAASHPPAKN